MMPIPMPMAAANYGANADPTLEELELVPLYEDEMIGDGDTVRPHCTACHAPRDPSARAARVLLSTENALSSRASCALFVQAALATVSRGGRVSKNGAPKWSSFTIPVFVSDEKLSEIRGVDADEVELLPWIKSVDPNAHHGRRRADCPSSCVRLSWPRRLKKPQSPERIRKDELKPKSTGEVDLQGQLFRIYPCRICQGQDPGQR